MSLAYRVLPVKWFVKWHWFRVNWRKRLQRWKHKLIRTTFCRPFGHNFYNSSGWHGGSKTCKRCRLYVLYAPSTYTPKVLNGLEVVFEYLDRKKSV
jgi:hypothetical protein